MVIKKDLFNISKRIKRFNKNFKIIYNMKARRFEIQEKKLLGYRVYCVIPYDKLDFRTLQYIYAPINTDYKTIFREVEEYNENIDKRKNEENTYIIKNKLKDIYKYSSLSKDFDTGQAFRNTWV